MTQLVNRTLAAALQLIARQLKRYTLTVPPCAQPNTRPITSGKEERSPPALNVPTKLPWPDFLRPRQQTTSIQRNPPPVPKPFPPPMMPVIIRSPLGLTQTMTHSLTNAIAIRQTSRAPLLPLTM
ncbi:hypothetical protein NDU88_007335 [Pleurodeles waltl]|uniref:Uncharacterized protein n=1 Tax=Pleurodeles waltl TaxID=8319 RepID=A0AAV7QRL1_PLEWA|nr:hypothetical protein NDU88_007335 [Pleurodeles waltl]